MVVKKEYILIISCLLIWLPAIAGEYPLTNGDFESGEGYYDADGWSVFDGNSGGRAVYFAPGEQPNEYLENPDLNSHRAAALKSNGMPFVQQELKGIWGVFYDRYTIDCSLGYRNDAFTDGDIPMRISVWDITNDRELAGVDIILPDPGFATGSVPTAQWNRYQVILEVDTTSLSNEKIAVRFTNANPRIVSARATALIDNVNLTVPDVSLPVRPVWPEDDTGIIPVDHEPTLEWLSGTAPEISFHAVFFGIDEYRITTAEYTDPDANIFPQAIESFQYPQALQYETTYYWRVDEILGDVDDPTEVLTGSVWSFTTEPKPCSGYSHDGDLNDDCIVNIEDLILFANDWLFNGPGTTGDIDENQLVDYSDYLYLSGDWLSRVDTFDRKNVILWIGAHCDDELFGAGSAFARYCSDYGNRGVFAMVTTGRYDWYDENEIRRDEARLAAARLNAEARFVNIQAGLVPQNIDLLTQRLTRMYREIQPDVIITHGPEGEYGHNDHKAVSQAASSAYYTAADADSFPEQLTDGLTTWAASKLYRIVELNNTDPITLVIDGNVYSDALRMSYYEYSEQVIRSSHITQTGVFNSHPPRDHTNLSLIDSRVPGPDEETSILDGVPKGLSKPIGIRNWLICGPFTEYQGDLGHDYLTGDGGENNINPVPAMETAGNVWSETSQERDYVDFKQLCAPDNSNAVAYAYTKIKSSTRQQKILQLCSNKGVMLWLNGSLVYEQPDERSFDYEDRIAVMLEAGINHILVKVKAGAPFYYQENHYPSQHETYPWVIEAWGFYCIMDMSHVQKVAL